MVKTKNKTLYNSMIISLLVHGVIIYLLPRFRQKVSENRIGSYTNIELISYSSGQSQKKEAIVPTQKEGPDPEKDIPVPELDPRVENLLDEIKDISIPPFEAALPIPKETPSLSPEDLNLNNELLMAEESLLEPEPKPLPEEMREKKDLSIPIEEAAVNKVKDLPRLPVEEPIEEPEVENETWVEKTTISGDGMNIEWSGKPRRIIDKPAYPPTYPPGYKGQLEGKIRLQFWVDASGFVIRVRPLQKLDPRLDTVATEYLRQYRFEPLSKEHIKESQWGIIPFSFRLK